MANNPLTSDQQTQISNMQTALAAAHVAAETAANLIEGVRVAALSIGTADARDASNAALEAKGIAQQAMGMLNVAHAKLSMALLAYSSGNGGAIVQGGGGGRNH